MDGVVYQIKGPKFWLRCQLRQFLFFFFFLVGSKRRIAIHSLNKGYGKVKARDNPNNYEADCLFCLYNYNGFGHISRNLIK